MRITALDGSLATIATEGLEQECSLALLPEARVGDYVLVHAGFAISVIDEDEANETLELLREISAFGDEEDAASSGGRLEEPSGDDANAGGGDAAG
jgi:hydrogenase expression/formation protein HypC